MPIFLLANWRWLLPSIVAVGLGIMLAFTKAELISLQADVDRQKAEAAQLLAQKTAEVAAKEAAAADLNAKLEDQRHVSELAASDADSRLRAALAGVRRQQGGGCGGSSTMPTGASAGGAENAPQGGDGGLAAGMDDLTARTAAAANVLAAYARECNSWAESLK